MRYLPLTPADRSAMLEVVGAPDIDSLFADIPHEHRLDGPIEGLPLHASELSVERHMKALAAKNVAAGDVPFFIGAGAYRHHIPASVDHLIQRGEFLTAYTPYQPEIAQGTLQMLFEFQTQVARLYGCAVANASMYDGSTACWEAVGMARRITRRGRVLLSDGLHPHYVATIRTMAKFTGDAIVGEMPKLEAACDEDALIAALDDETSCVVMQYPDILGRLPDLAKIAEATHAAGALLVAVVTEPVALGAIKSPGELGADIVVGEGQSIGVGLQFGGPYLGLFAVRDPKHVRQMPGRLCGETVDAEGKRGFVLTLSTREQHIRRERATSNICTNHGLIALSMTIRTAMLGRTGFEHVAKTCLSRAEYLKQALVATGKVSLAYTGPTFNEFVIRRKSGSAQALVDAGITQGILAGIPVGERDLLVAVTEKRTKADLDRLVALVSSAE